MNGMQNDRNNLMTELQNFSPSSDEKKFIPRFIDLLKSDRSFYRDHFNPGHITGSAILLNPEGTEILMNYHKSLDKWLNFGGHADGDEDILAVAIKETMEESGMTAFKPISSDFIDIDIHEIPANNNKNEPAHYHFDIRYVMQMTENQQPVVSDESLELKWMTFDEALKVSDKSLARLINKIKEGL